jgi:hypothetical protein
MTTILPRLLVFVLLVLVTTRPAAAAPTRQTEPYARAGWTMRLSTLQHGVSGTATIVDARTIVLRDFNYDGGGPQVYAYLAVTDTRNAYYGGIPIGPLLTRPNQPYVSQTLTLTLPATQTLDTYNALSIWCVDFGVIFGSGTFTAPLPVSATHAVYIAGILNNK